MLKPKAWYFAIYSLQSVDQTYEFDFQGARRDISLLGYKKYVLNIEH